MSNSVFSILISLVTGFYGLTDPFSEKEEKIANSGALLSMYSTSVDTPPYRPDDGPGDPTMRDEPSGFQYRPPSNMHTDYELDEEGEGYYIYERVGNYDIRHPSYITREDYAAYRQDKSIKDYWQQRNATVDEVLPQGLKLGINVNDPKFKDIFGGGSIEIRPNGTALLEFSGDINRMKNPALPIRQQRTANFNFDQQIQLNVVGKIGEKLRLTANWDTQATFDFENQIKVEYTGTEDEIIQKIEAGNVSLPLRGSLISGGQNLFGVKAALKFGPLIVTTVASIQRGKTKSITTEGGSQVTEYQMLANDYDNDRHFFLAQHFRNRYDYANSSLPNINSGYSFTGRIEVWKTNSNNASTVNNRNCVGFVDLAEQDDVRVDQGIGSVWNTTRFGTHTGPDYPDNKTNSLYSNVTANPANRSLSRIDTVLSQGLGLKGGVDYERVQNMQLLREGQDYTLNPKLGFISLTSRLQPNQVLMVSYEYMINGKIYQVGEFTQDKPADQNEILFLKMLKPSSVQPEVDGRPYPAWNLSMKNIYSIGGYGLRPDNFRFEVFYKSPSSAGDLAYLTTRSGVNRQLLQLLEIDRLTNNNAAGSDNLFDFLEGITIESNRGLVIFPRIEPFGSHLGKVLGNTEDSAKYAFPQLYSKTKVDAIQKHQDLDRYVFKGSYQSASSSEIQLNALNIAPGSVKVTANGNLLNEGLDYTVDYQIGKVNVINQGLLTSGQQIKVEFETNSLFGIQSKSLVGSRFDLQVDKDIQLGATILHLNEQPLTNKIIIGDEPVSNTIWGLDALIQKDSRLLTKIVDAIPGIQTKEISTITGQAEFAQLLPGHPKRIQVKQDGEVIENGIGFLDDFESAKTTFDLRGNRSWSMSSFPGDNGENNLYDPRTKYNHVHSPGFSRAKLAWYSIDNQFYTNGSIDFPKTDLDDPFVHLVSPTEVFPNQTVVTGNNQERTFDLYYLPGERGPYNFQTDPSKVNPDGTLSQPTENWGGIMRRTSGNTDFEASNYEFLEFWLMDPFADNVAGSPHIDDGEFYINLGKISEDVLPDGYMSIENGLPETGDYSLIDTTTWGYVPKIIPPNPAFSNVATARPFQDAGLDGMPNTEEIKFHSDYLTNIASVVTDPDALGRIQADPSNDDYKFFRSGDLDGVGILKRYLDYNDTEGNTPVGAAATQNGLSTQGSSTPDVEDMNSDGSLNTLASERYWEYKINVKNGELVRGRNFVVDEIESSYNTSTGTTKQIKWYQFRIPLTAGIPVGEIQNFKAIDFVRLYMTGFAQPVVMRMARFQLVSTSWRTYKEGLLSEGEVIEPEPVEPLTSFEIGTVNIEQNGSRQPYPYILPPRVQRQNQVGNVQPNLLQNEQALVMRVCDLQDGDAKAAYRVQPQPWDLRSYKKLKMWVHMERGIEDDPIRSNVENPGDLKAFVRLGSDNSQNYYEYEIPLSRTDRSYNPQTIQSEPLEADQFECWKNEFNFDLADLNTAKGLRNSSIALSGDNNILFSRYKVFPDPDDTLKVVYVVGTPKLSEVKSIMIGVRNPQDGNGAVCSEVWFNELRVVDFNETSGQAANARINFKLADFGNISASGAYRSPGFGSLEQRINDRSRETTVQYDLAGNFSMGKFFPKKWGIEIPLYVTHGQKWILPQFNPLESDVNLDNFVETVYTNEEDRKAFKRSVSTLTKNYSVSLNNIRKIRTKTEGKTHFWDIENWALSLSWSKVTLENFQVEMRQSIQHRAGIRYNYNFNPKLIKFFKAPKRKNPITEFNFYLGPKSISFNLEGQRQFEFNQIRQQAGQAKLDPTYFRNFSISRTYNLRWDFTRSLSLTFNAANRGRVDENIFGPTKMDTLKRNLLTFGNTEATGYYRDSVGYYYAPGKDKIINLGRNTNYNHSFNLNYVLPFDKFKWTNWISGNVSYQGGLQWQAAPDNNPTLGNTLGNNNTLQGTGRLTLNNLYEKIPGYKKFMAGNKAPPQVQGLKKPGVNPTEKENEAKKDTTKKEDSFVFLKGIGRELVRMITSVQNIDVTYNRQATTQLPGYLPNTDLFGFDFNHRWRDSLLGSFHQSPGTPPPTFGFMAGWQMDQKEILRRGKEEGWLTKDSRLSSQFSQGWTEQLTGRTAITLFKELKIDLNVTRSKAENSSGLMRWNEETQNFELTNKLTTGSYSTSYIFLNTAFESNGRDKTFSEAFQAFENSRFTISGRLADRNPLINKLSDGDPALNEYGGYQQGYYRNSQDVLLPAFLSAYSPFKPDNVTVNPFPSIPLPNWSINYNGLSKIGFLKKVFNQVSLKHTYRGTYAVGGYTSNVNFGDIENAFTDRMLFAATTDQGDSIFNFRSKYVIPSVSITEAFAPLIGVNMTWKNGLSTSFDYKMSRNMAFNVGNLQLNETRTQDISISISWRKDKLDKTIRLFKRDIQLKNSLNARFEMTMQDRKTRNRRLDSNESQAIIGGNFLLILKPTIDYTVNQKLNVMFFVEQNFNTPYISTSFPSSFTSIGFRIRFTLN